MEKRLKSLETEIAYLRKAIEKLINSCQSLDSENHYHLTNIYMSKEFLDNHFQNGGEYGH